MIESMDYINIPTWGALVIVIVQIIVGAFIYRFSKYMGKKGEYQAMKEEIGKITATIEGIKQNNAKELEGLKSQLTILTSQKTIIFEDAKKALYDYYVILNRYITDIEVYYNDGDTVDILKERMNVCYNEGIKITSCISMIQLIVSDEIIVDSARTVFDKFNKIWKAKLGLLFDIKEQLKELEEYKTSNNKRKYYEIKEKTMPKLIYDYRVATDKQLDEMIDVMNVYQSDVNAFLNNL
ncbi:MAG: hypothetical protein N4A71_00380 [Carboxylicivirga sp.]|jgi:Tfp pilus assembly protein PilO|nr:hypothetical protein [Carboxylicivirga sp.]